MIELEADGHEEDALRLRRKQRFRRLQLIGFGLFLTLAFIRIAPAIVSALHDGTPVHVLGSTQDKLAHAPQSPPAASDDSAATPAGPISLAGRSQTGSGVRDRALSSQ